MCEEDLYEYGGQCVTKAHLCWAMSTSSGSWTATKVGKFTKFPETELSYVSEFTNCFKVESNCE